MLNKREFNMKLLNTVFPMPANSCNSNFLISKSLKNKKRQPQRLFKSLKQFANKKIPASRIQSPVSNQQTTHLLSQSMKLKQVELKLSVTENLESCKNNNFPVRHYIKSASQLYKNLYQSHKKRQKQIQQLVLNHSLFKFAQNYNCNPSEGIQKSTISTHKTFRKSTKSQENSRESKKQIKQNSIFEDGVIQGWIITPQKQMLHNELFHQK